MGFEKQTPEQIKGMKAMRKQPDEGLTSHRAEVKEGGRPRISKHWGYKENRMKPEARHPKLDRRVGDLYLYIHWDSLGIPSLIIGEEGGDGSTSKRIPFMAFDHSGNELFDDSDIKEFFEYGVKCATDGLGIREIAEKVDDWEEKRIEKLENKK